MPDHEWEAEFLSPIAAIDLFMKKYSVMYSALLMRATAFTSHVRNNQLVATVIAAIVYLTFQTERFKLQDSTKWWWIMATLFVMCVTYYIWYDTLDAHFAVVSHSARVKSLEAQINKIVGRKILIWETEIAPMLWGSPHPLKGVWHPVWFMLLYQSILMFLIAVAFPLYVYFVIWNFPASIWSLKTILIALALVSVVSMATAYYVWHGINRHLGRGIAQFVNEHWEPDERAETPAESVKE